MCWIAAEGWPFGVQYPWFACIPGKPRWMKSAWFLPNRNNVCCKSTFLTKHSLLLKHCSSSPNSHFISVPNTDNTAYLYVSVLLIQQPTTICCNETMYIYMYNIMYNIKCGSNLFDAISWFLAFGLIGWWPPLWTKVVWSHVLSSWVENQHHWNHWV